MHQPQHTEFEVSVPFLKVSLLFFELCHFLSLMWLINLMIFLYFNYSYCSSLEILKLNCPRLNNLQLLVIYLTIITLP